MDSDQDIDIEIVDKDSGMSSLGGSKDETPERRVIIVGFPATWREAPHEQRLRVGARVVCLCVCVRASVCQCYWCGLIPLRVCVCALQEDLQDDDDQAVVRRDVSAVGDNYDEVCRVAYTMCVISIIYQLNHSAHITSILLIAVRCYFLFALSLD